MNLTTKKLSALFTSLALVGSLGMGLATSNDANATGLNDASSTLSGKASIQRDRNLRAETQALEATARNYELTAITNHYYNANDDIIIGDFGASGDWNANDGAYLNNGIDADNYVESNGAKIITDGDGNIISTDQEHLGTSAAGATGNDGVTAGGGSQDTSAGGNLGTIYGSDDQSVSTSDYDYFHQSTTETTVTDEATLGVEINYDAPLPLHCAPSCP